MIRKELAQKIAKESLQKIADSMHTSNELREQIRKELRNPDADYKTILTNIQNSNQGARN